MQPAAPIAAPPQGPLPQPPPGFAPPASPKGAGGNRRLIAGVVIVVLVVGGIGAAAMMGAFTGPGQCVLQEMDSQGNVQYTRGENYSESECDAYCQAHLPPNGGARGCWFDEY